MGEARRRQDVLKAPSSATPADAGSFGAAAPARLRADDVLAGAGGLVFLLECMMLPLVGRAGALTAYYGHNMIAFTAAAFLCMGLSGTALALKLRERSGNAASFPWGCTALVCINVALIAALLLGALRQ